jgi:Na+-transporting methylmalonyl-CoA/oxaloacetate decarboxylase beta subunit
MKVYRHMFTLFTFIQNIYNIPGAGIAEGNGILHIFYEVGIESGAFPLIIFMGVGALTDFEAT